MIDWRELRDAAWYIAMLALIAIALLAFWGVANATWKPEYANEPQSVQDWFKEAKPPALGSLRLGISYCCERAERLMTRFVGSPSGEWSYYTDPNCVHRGCALAPIPNDVVHSESIKALDPKDNDLPQFQAMRREGVLFIWQGKPTCFWPPESGI